MKGKVFYCNDMIPYIIIYLFVLFIIIAQENNIDINIKITSYRVPALLIFTILLIYCFYAFRVDVGYDYPMYYQIINTGTQEGYCARNEWLSYLFLDIASANASPWVFFALIAVVAVPLYLYVISRYTEESNSLGWGLLLFLSLPIGLLQTLSVSRQFAAVAIFLFSIKYIIYRKKIMYFICIVLAAMFHFSILLQLPLYWIASNKFKYKYFIMFFAMFLGIILPSLVYVISAYFPMYAPYLQFTFFDQGGESQIILYIILGMCFLFTRDYWSQSKYYDTYLKIYLYGIIFVVIFSFMGGLAGIRLGFASLSVSFLLITYFLNAFKGINKIIIKFLFITILTVLYIYSFSITSYGTYIPYKTMLF